MNEQLQGKLVEILSGIQSATKAAGDFALEQLPDIAQQYVAYGRAYHSAWFLGAAVALTLGFVLIKRSFRKDVSSDAALGLVFSGVPSLFFGIVAGGINASSFLMVWLAPKVWLLKELASLVK